MKYESEFNELASLFYEDWMEKKDEKEFKQNLLEALGPNHFDDMIDWGVNNSVGPQVQIEMLRRIIKNEG